VQEMEDLKVKHMQTEIPAELNARINTAIKRGAIRIKKRRSCQTFVKVLSSIAAALLVFVGALNGSPAFATYVGSLPGGETIVRLLTFVGDRAIGGEITDGQDIRRITVERSADYETIQVDFTWGFTLVQGEPRGAAVGTAGHFTVTRKTHPESIIVHVGGVRSFSAAQSLPDLARMQFIGSIYRLITLDDSAHRFAVTFTRPVAVEVTEQRNPARIVIRVSEDKQAEQLPAMYSLRTASMPLGETVGHAEEDLKFRLGSEQARIQQDIAGYYLAEEGLYTTRAEAERRMIALTTAGFGRPLYIERRDAKAVPQHIKP